MRRCCVNEAALRDALPDADALVVDLTSDVPERIEHVRALRSDGVKTLAFYSHVEADVRDRAARRASTSSSRARGWRARGGGCWTG